MDSATRYFKSSQLSLMAPSLLICWNFKANGELEELKKNLGDYWPEYNVINVLFGPCHTWHYLSCNVVYKRCVVHKFVSLGWHKRIIWKCRTIHWDFVLTLKFKMGFVLFLETTQTWWLVNYHLTHLNLFLQRWEFDVMQPRLFNIKLMTT